MERKTLQIVILFGSIVILGLIGYWARRKVKHHEDMSVAGRTCTSGDIFWSTYAFWGGNTIMSIIELGSDMGVAGIWFGIARLLMFLIILLVCMAPFRNKFMVTISEFIGTAFKSRFLGCLAGTNIGLNFVFLLVSAIVGAQAFFVNLLGWSTLSAVLFTVFSFLIYVILAGMYGIVYTSRIIAIGQMTAVLIAAGWGLYAAGWHNIMQLPPSYFEFAPKAQYATILVWVYAFVNNAFLAQAAIQIIMSCKSVKAGQRGIWYILAAFIPTILLSIFIGMAAKTLFPTIKGIQAAPAIASAIQSPIISTIVVLGLYFSALGWGTPLVLTGGTCLANDVYGYFKKNPTSRELINVTRVGLVIITLLAIVFAWAIPFGVAFWVIVGFVARNCALFPLILAALFWNLLSARWAVIASSLGLVVGLLWYVIKYPLFLWGAPPMFIGMIVSITVLWFGTFWDFRHDLSITVQGVRGKFWISLIFISVILMVLTLLNLHTLHGMKLFVPLITIEYNVLFLATIFVVRKRKEENEIGTVSSSDTEVNRGACFR